MRKKLEVALTIAEFAATAVLIAVPAVRHIANELVATMAKVSLIQNKE